MRERQLNEWWREEGEDKIVAKELRESNKMKEFELKAGSDGKDTPDIKKMYATKTTTDFGKKGVNEKKVAQKKKVQEEFEDEIEDQDLDMDSDLDSDMGDEDMDDINMESDVPADVTDPNMLDGDSGVDVSDITITVGGKTYTLVASDEGMGDEMGDEGLEDEMGDEDFDSEGMDGEDIDVNSEAAEMDANAEDDDITYQESRKILRKKIREMADEDKEVDDSFYDEVLESAIKEVKNRLKKESVGSERKAKTASFSSNGDAKDGTKEIGKDHSFAKKGETKSGTKYTPSKSDSVYEARAKRKEEFKAWLEQQEAKKKKVEEETDPFEDDITPDETIGDDFANMPTEVGADPKVIEKYNRVKSERAKRLQKEAVEQDPKFPNKDVKKDVEGSLKESFDFKKLVRGEYK